MPPDTRRNASTSDLPFTPGATYAARPVRHVVVLDHGGTPTLGYYIRPRLTSADTVPTTIIDISHSPPHALPEASFVIIIRYLNEAWARQLRSQRDLLAGVAYLMDDDLPAALHAPHLPWRYRYKIFRLFHRQRRALGAICDAIWVSTPLLADKYAHPRVALLPPLPLTGERIGSCHGITYFYHGSASHGPEFDWLREVVRQVQHAAPHLTFIALGDARVRRIYADLPRVMVLHPVSWSTYCESVPHIRHDIGLAPLLANDFNRGRSHTKFFDITRLGAVGLYSNVPPYSDHVRHREDGYLLDNDPDAWAETILRLADTPAERAAVLGRAQASISRALLADTGLPLPR